jgi:hypothetical protein
VFAGFGKKQLFGPGPRAQPDASPALLATKLRRELLSKLSKIR